MNFTCKSINCRRQTSQGEDFCRQCSDKRLDLCTESSQSMAEKYPKYYKSVGELTEIDVYATHQIFNLQDPSGALHHASKKLLLSGARTGGKSARKDITEARDTLTRWLQLNPEKHEPISTHY